MAALVLILGLAAYLRLANLAHNPGWYTDEGTQLNIAQNLLRGRVQYLAIDQSTLLFARLPLFEFALAGVLGVGDGGIDALRAFTGTLGVAAVGLLYGVVRRSQAGQDAALALLSASMLAIYPQAVLYSRFGFSYNFLTPLVLLACLGLGEYLNTSRRGWLALAALAVGIGALSDLMMLALALPLALVVSARRWRDVLWSMLLVLLPLGVYTALMLVHAPQVFLFDVRFTLSRLGAIPLAEQFAAIARNYTILVAQDAWIAAALVGLFILRPTRLQRLSLLFFLLPIMILGRAVALYSLSFYYMIPLLPFVALGVASLVRYGAPQVGHALRSGLLALLNGWGWQSGRLRWLRNNFLVTATYLPLLLVVAAPFLTSVILTVDRVRGNFGTVIDAFLIDPEDAQRVAEFVNEQTYAGDVVIASPAVAWLFQANAADFQMAVAATGRATAHLPADIPADRFAFDPRITQARFVVVDNLWRNWGAVHMPEVDTLMRQVETWPLVFAAGELAVYRNPAR